MEGMTFKEYVLRRLNQGETDLKVLARQTRIQFPSWGISFSYIRSIRNEWQKASASRRVNNSGPFGPICARRDACLRGEYGSRRRGGALPPRMHRSCRRARRAARASLWATGTPIKVESPKRRLVSKIFSSGSACGRVVRCWACP